MTVSLHRRLFAVTRAAFIAVTLVSSAALAQSPPYGKNSTEKTGTIGTTGTYQLVFAQAQNQARTGCLIQNNGSHTMLVFFGVAQPANNAGVGFTVPAANSISCGLVGGGVLLDNVWIEGTSGDTFEQASQP